MGNLAESINDPTKVTTFAQGITAAVTGTGLNVLLDFGASQLGLDGLKQSVRNVLQFIPRTVENLLRRLISTIVSRIAAVLPGNGSTGLYAGVVGTVRSFTY